MGACFLLVVELSLLDCSSAAQGTGEIGATLCVMRRGQVDARGVIGLTGMETEESDHGEAATLRTAHFCLAWNRATYRQPSEEVKCELIFRHALPKKLVR